MKKLLSLMLSILMFSVFTLVPAYGSETESLTNDPYAILSKGIENLIEVESFQLDISTKADVYILSEGEAETIVNKSNMTLQYNDDALYLSIPIFEDSIVEFIYKDGDLYGRVEELSPDWVYLPGEYLEELFFEIMEIDTFYIDEKVTQEPNDYNPIGEDILSELITAFEKIKMSQPVLSLVARDGGYYHKVFVTFNADEYSRLFFTMIMPEYADLWNNSTSTITLTFYVNALTGYFEIMNMQFVSKSLRPQILWGIPVEKLNGEYSVTFKLSQINEDILIPTPDISWMSELDTLMSYPIYEADSEDLYAL